MRRFAALSLAAVVVACATPADKITDALIDYGLPEKQARCMGERLEARLSLEQLQRLSELARANRGQGKVSVNRLADQLNREGDPKLVTAVVGAGVSCLF
ncbi:hypothetical protein [Glacieibacterium frigidum]|uniref:Lipoprotein n=1 Tax=Glacieibacterium frigidum TaxID=2593303 RepID=A0A552UIV9_9SPHN|nr:hypothetical protein [Glacieibacterium frigidum]TRW18144.1 hypothetical protein FMM06_08575 [Glacieibacterium frigidum]